MKIIHTLILGIAFSNINAVDSVTLYRRPYNRLEVGLCDVVAGASCLGGGIIMGGLTLDDPADSGLRDLFRTAFKRAILAPLCTLAPMWVVLQSIRLRKWNALTKKPKVIFDRKGFTYERFDFWGDHYDCRYEWKDVLKCWARETYDEYGLFKISKEWCYHIRDQGLVEINVDELTIPKELEPEMELIARGIFD